jgi:serine protease Do
MKMGEPGTAVRCLIRIVVCAPVKEQIVAPGYSSQARLGVTIQEVNQAPSFRLDRLEGALIAQVAPGSPADKS